MITDLRDTQTIVGEDLKTIAYYMGKRIVKDTVDNLYYEIIPKSSMQLTDLLTLDRLTPITALPRQEQAAIREFVKEVL